MNKDLIVAYRVNCRKVSNPKTLWRKLKPRKHKNFAWIPQTLSGEIWMWFEFFNEQEKQLYINNLKPIRVLNFFAKVQQGKTENEETEFFFNPSEHFMHTENWFTQDQVNYWINNKTPIKRIPRELEVEKNGHRMIIEAEISNKTRKPMCSIKCVDDTLITDDLSEGVKKRYSFASFSLDASNIHKIIEKLKEIELFLIDC